MAGAGTVEGGTDERVAAEDVAVSVAAAVDTEATAARNARAWGGAEISRDARIVRGDAPGP